MGKRCPPKKGRIIIGGGLLEKRWAHLLQYDSFIAMRD
jgi:hypothetical protein